MNRLRIVSNNCFWFQGRPFASDRPGTPVAEIIDGLASVYRELAPDLLCLQEVQDLAAFEAISSRLAMDGEWCPGGELAQYGGAVLYKEGRLASDSRSAKTRTQRMWQLVEAPLPVANVHLPSSRQLSEEAAERARIEELTELLDRPAPPLILLGDFNEQPGGPLGDFLSQKGYHDAAVLTGREHLASTPKNRRGDQIWVADDIKERVVGYGATPEPRMRSDLAGKEHLSDHFPVWIDLAE